MSTKEATRSVKSRTATITKTRRHFLVGTLGIVTGVFGWRFKTEEKTLLQRPLKEADFYKPHDLAG